MPPRRRGRSSGTGGTPPVFDPVVMETMIAERVASALVAYELANPRNGNGGGGGAGNPWEAAEIQGRVHIKTL